MGTSFGLGVGEEWRDPRGLRGGWAADLQARRDRFQRACGVVVEFEVGGLLGIANPEVDVGFVPHFELPGGDFVDAVALDEVLSEGGDHRVPQRVVAWAARRSACTRRRAARWDRRPSSSA